MRTFLIALTLVSALPLHAGNAGYQYKDISPEAASPYRKEIQKQTEKEKQLTKERTPATEAPAEKKPRIRGENRHR